MCYDSWQNTTRTKRQHTYNVQKKHLEQQPNTKPNNTPQIHQQHPAGTSHSIGGPVVRGRMCFTVPTVRAAAIACLLRFRLEFPLDNNSGFFLMAARMRLSDLSETPSIPDTSRTDFNELSPAMNNACERQATQPRAQHATNTHVFTIRRGSGRHRWMQMR